MRALTNLRKYPRYQLVAPIQVSWKDARGVDRNHEGYCLEASVGGLKMELSDAVPTYTSVTLRIPEPQFNGFAVVRHCTVVGPRYLLGVALQSPASKALQAKVAVEHRRRQQREEDLALESLIARAQPPDDHIRTFFQDVKVRKSRRAASMRVRQRGLLGVAVVVWVAVGVLLFLNQPWLLRVASAIYRHPLGQKAAAFVEAVINHGR
jgi:hypothetical protein